MNIYIGNLSLQTTEEELREEFGRFGVVISVTIMNDKYIGSGQPRGYGYIQMSSKEAGAAAIATLQGKVMKEHTITVVEALPLTKNESVSPSEAGKKHPYTKRNRINNFRTTG